jgi:hypothetical protein
MIQKWGQKDEMQIMVGTKLVSSGRHVVILSVWAQILDFWVDFAGPHVVWDVAATP